VHEKFDGNATFHLKSKLFVLHIYTDLGEKANHRFRSMWTPHNSAVMGGRGGGILSHAVVERWRW